MVTLVIVFILLGVCGRVVRSLPLLYVLTMEVLAVNIRAHLDIVGLRLPGIPDRSMLIIHYFCF